MVSPADGASNSEEELKQLQQRCADELASARSSYYKTSSRSATPVIPSSSSIHTPSAPGTPSGVTTSYQIPRISTDTSTLLPETPGSTGSHSSDHSFTNDSRDISALPRSSIPGGDKCKCFFVQLSRINRRIIMNNIYHIYFIARKSRDWLTNEQECADYGHHLTIGPHGGVDWVKRLVQETGGRKSSDSEISGVGTSSNSGDEMGLHRSTDCITKEVSTSSDNDFIR